jgi:hypothetical protein
MISNNYKLITIIEIIKHYPKTNNTAYWDMHSTYLSNQGGFYLGTMLLTPIFFFNKFYFPLLQTNL